MKDRTFLRVMVIISAVGCAVAVGLLIYTAVLYKNLSITSFISNGR